MILFYTCFICSGEFDWSHLCWEPNGHRLGWPHSHGARPWLAKTRREDGNAGAPAKKLGDVGDKPWWCVVWLFLFARSGDSESSRLSFFGGSCIPFDSRKVIYKHAYDHIKNGRSNSQNDQVCARVTATTRYCNLFWECLSYWGCKL